MKLRTVVSIVPYEWTSERHINQAEAMNQMASLEPAWSYTRYVVLPHERVLDGSSPLPRSGAPVTDGHAVPYLRDMLTVAFQDAEPEDWGGILNSDIVVTPKFFEAIEDADMASQEVVICHRTDVPTIDTPPEQGRKVNRKRCCDGVFMTREVWDRLGDSIPDYVIGYPYWDTGMIWWSKMQRLKTVRLIDHEILHVNHGGRWNYKNAGTKYNGKLNRWMVNALLGTKTKAQRRKRHR